MFKYEEFLNERLRSDLKWIMDTRESLYSEVGEYLQLRNTIEKISSAGLPQNRLKTMVDIGCNFYIQAVVPNSSSVIVAVGLNVYVQFTHEEALKFIEKKVKHLNHKIDDLTKRAADVSARIKLVLQGLKELQFSKTFDEINQPYRVVW